MTNKHEESVSSPLVELLDNYRKKGDEIDSDAVLMIFMEYVDLLGIELYPAQEEAILELLAYNHVILNTPTGSGKSMVALALQFQALAEGRIAWYTAPTKALVNEKFFWLCDVMGSSNVGLVTGDGAVNPDAHIICCTAEVLANKALRDDNVVIDYVIMDEFHYYGDRDRGVAWQIPLITMKDSVFLLMSATLGNTDLIAKSLENFTDRTVSIVKNIKRPVPLEFEYREAHTHETVEDLSDNKLTPVYLVNFTQRECAEQAQNLMSINVSSKESKKLIAKEIGELKFDTPYGKEFSRFVRHGIGVHHAGLLPKYRRVVEKLAQQGLIKVISGTDTLGVGVNIPIHTVVIRQLYKFNGVKQTIITAREFHQIAGRAGRKGFDDSGLAVIQAPEWVVENRRIEAKILKSPHLKRKLKKRNPPLNAIPWDRDTFDRLIKSEPEPLTPRFEVTHGMIINLMQSSGNGYRRLVDLIYRSHGSSADKSQRRKRAAALMRSLTGAGIVEIRKSDEGKGCRFVLSDTLQDDFSLDHALSLYLATTIEMLEEGEERELNMLTLVEAILDDPKAVLYRQLDKVKSELVAKLKMEGMPYDERMEELDKADYPKPNLEFIEDTFTAFAQSHPWLEKGYIHPKNIAREIYENCYDFNYYVSQYGLARSEGVLLRYLSQVYKAAVQNVPKELWTEEFENILAFFHGMVRRVDSTLIEEWVLLGNRPSDINVEHNDEHVPSILDDMRAFRARIRNEMHALLRAIAKKEWNEAIELTFVTDDSLFDAVEIESAMESYFNEFDYIDLTPLARSTSNTIFKPVAHKVWTIYQKIIDPDQNGDFGIECIVDMTRARDETMPLIELKKIGV